MTISRSPSRPPSGGPSYSPDSLPVYRGGSAGGGGAPSCSVTLVTDDVAAVGWQAASIDGQRAYITGSGADAIYGASTDLAAATPIWSSGTRFVEGQSVTRSTTAVRASIFLAAPNFSKYFQARVMTGGSWEFLTDAGPLVTNQGALGSAVAIGIDGATGDLKAYVQGVGEITLGAGATAYWDTSAVAIAANIDTSGTGQDGSITVVTAAAAYLAGATGQDYCGNAL